MSSPHRRAERQAEFEAEQERRRREEVRRAALTMWERIDEAEASSDVKELLHMFAEKLGLED